MSLEVLSADWYSQNVKENRSDFIVSGGSIIHIYTFIQTFVFFLSLATKFKKN